MHAYCVRVWVLVYAWASRTHFGQKLTKSTNGNFQACPRKQVQSWILALRPATYWTDAAKAFASSFKKWVRKIKIKIIGVVKRCALIHKPKNWQRFFKHMYFNNVCSTGALCQLISSIAKDLLDFLWFIGDFRGNFSRIQTNKTNR